MPATADIISCCFTFCSLYTKTALHVAIELVKGLQFNVRQRTHIACMGACDVSRMAIYV